MNLLEYLESAKTYEVVSTTYNLKTGESWRTTEKHESTSIEMLLHSLEKVKQANYLIIFHKIEEQRIPV